jgi:Ca2+/Na+ antiporter
VNKIKKHKDFKNHAKFIDYFAKNNINDIAIINNKLIKKRTIIRNIMLKLLSYCVLIILLHHFLLFSPQAPVKVSFYNPTFSILFFICTYLGYGIYLFYDSKKIFKKPIDEYLIFLHKVKNRIEALSDREIYLMLNKKELSNHKYRILRCFSKIKTINK